MTHSPESPGKWEGLGLHSRYPCLGEKMVETCPESEQLAAFATGVLPAPEQSAVESHLTRCRLCLDVIAFAIKAKTEVPRPPLETRG